MEEVKTEETVTETVSARAHRDWLGTALGLAIFLGGMFLLYTVFRQALDLFTTPPKVELKVQPGKPIELASAFNAIVGVVWKIVLLIVMAWLGSLIANRGISLYSHSRAGRKA